MSTKTLYIAQNVRLYLSQPLNPRREMLDAMMDPYPEIKADLTEKLEHRTSSYDDLSDEYYDRQVELLDSIAPKQLQSNILIAGLGSLLFYDLADFTNIDGIESIVVDHFQTTESEIQLVFKVVTDVATDPRAIINYLAAQISDGWGENGSEPMRIAVSDTANPRIFARNTYDAEISLRQYLSAYTITKGDPAISKALADSLYTPKRMSHLLNAIKFDNQHFEMRVDFDSKMPVII